MTEIAIPNGQHADVVPTGAQTSALVLWAYEARQAEQIATSLARTSFVPASLRGKPDDLTAAILAGQELGLQPMATLRSIDVIQGTPALRAHAMRGLVQSHGHSVQVVESTPDRCVMRGRRAGEKDWQQVEWTIERAAQLGLTGKDQWKKQPQTMLVARATGEICRLIAADVLYAMPYAAEELDGESPGGGGGPARVTVEEIVTARQGPAEQPTPPAAPEPEQPRMITAAQMKKMAAGMRTAGLTDRDTALAFVNEILQRPADNPVASRNELTLDEASRVIDALEREAAQAEDPVDADVIEDGE
ncbi:hypothetical protein ABZW11_16980 [Nonomuraea sp. NPDC004580]|uniref:hypothetical protein n=1 Tax=Nonomuraea sp. NPDC004580 TaxID=3154552 RepID=UPI0033A136C9